jgi:hypothetical protein
MKKSSYRQTRETIQAIPAQSVPLTATDSANPEIALQFVGRAALPAKSESFSNQVRKKPVSVEASDGALQNL